MEYGMCIEKVQILYTNEILQKKIRQNTNPMETS